MNKFKQILPPRDRVWADPFVLYRDGQHHVFIEEMLFSEGCGHISHMTIDKDGNASSPTPIIKKPYHMSYPYLFDFEDQLYMIPETGENGTIDVYRCTDFPLKWEFEKSLMTGIFGVDATLHEDNGIWWMFVTIRDNPGTGHLDELFLYSANSPLSTDWTAHPANPISSDVRNARQAGNIFSEKGKFYRPAQNGSHHYGYGMKINYIKKLTTEHYEEECISEVKPNWDRSIIACHTLNYDAGLTLSDATKLRFRFFGKDRS